MESTNHKIVDCGGASADMTAVPPAAEEGRCNSSQEDTMSLCRALETIFGEVGFSEFGFIETDRLVYHPEIREICEGNTCRNYNTSWACPPAVGTIEECRARVARYDTMLLFSRVYRLEDSFDFEGMTEGMKDFKRLVDRLQDRLQDGSGILPDFLLLSNEGCGRCASCTYPDAPCRYPQRLHHSLEGYGFIVSELAREAGVRYNNGACTVTYFGALLFRNAPQPTSKTQGKEANQP
jgi:predicted metal-binding protein